MTPTSLATSALWAIAFACIFAAGEPTPPQDANVICDDVRTCSGNGVAQGNGTCVCECDPEWYGESCDTHIAGLLPVKFGVIAPLVVLAFTVVALTTLHCRGLLTWGHRCLTIEILLSTGDFASDLFWLLTEGFHSSWIFWCAVVCLILPGFILAFSCAVCWSIFNEKGNRLVAGMFKFSFFTLRVLVGFLGEKGVHPCYKENTALERFLINIFATTIMAAFVPVAFCVGSLLFCTLVVLLNVCMIALTLYLHASRMLVFGRVLDWLRWLWGLPSETLTFDWGLDKFCWHIHVISEIILESLPQAALNLANMTLMWMSYGRAPSWIAITSSVLSMYMSLRLGYRYVYYVCCRRMALDDIEIGALGTTA